MAYVFDKEKMFAQCEAVYSAYPTKINHLYDKLNALDNARLGASDYQRKTYIYEVALESCEVKLMPTCPYYFEIDTGRLRNSVTSTWEHEPGLANWLIEQDTELRAAFDAWYPPFNQNSVLQGAMFADFAHHYADVEVVLKEGYSGVKARAMHKQKEASKAGDAKASDFLGSVIRALDYAMAFGKKFAKKAEEMLQAETDPASIENLKRIAATAKRIPAQPAQTFYEALCAVTFVREICNALEGIGFAVLGHIDRLLYPYYNADIEAGRITPEEAQALIDAYIALTDARWDLTKELPGGTNATIVIGGCDRAGTVVYNQVTKMIIHSFATHRFANPKLQARVSIDHPQEYFSLLGNLAGMGTNVLSVFNDKVLIDAQVKAGKQTGDARLYLAGGCQEPTLSNELNSRAYVYLSLPTMLNAAIFPEQQSKLYSDAEIDFMPAYKADTFTQFYEMAMYNFNAQMLYIASKYNHFGRYWVKVNPCPLYSATMEGCIEKGMDISEGGARYNSDSMGLVGFGTAIDSLLAIKTAVYDEKYITMEQLRHALSTNFEENEVLRQYLLNRMPKYGQPNEEVAAFTAKFMADLSRSIVGYPNYRGGYWESSFFTFYAFEWLKNSPATADGRKQGAYLSRGINPSESTKNIDAATLLYAQEQMDYTRHAGGAVLYMDLPIVKGKQEGDIYSLSLIHI